MRVNPKTLKRARLEAGFTQESLAKKLKTSRFTIINIEKEKQEPGYKIIIKWLEVCGYSIVKNKGES